MKRLYLSGSPGKTRTCNLLVNSQPLLPIELPGSAYVIKSLQRARLPADHSIKKYYGNQGINKQQKSIAVKDFDRANNVNTHVLFETARNFLYSIQNL